VLHDFAALYRELGAELFLFLHARHGAAKARCDHSMLTYPSVSNFG